MSNIQKNRRKFIQISAVFSGALMLNPVGALTINDKLKTYGWKGIALGADSSLYISHTDEAIANKIIDECVSLVRRLESVFSLYDDNSAVTQLNVSGKLIAPPSDLLQLLNRSIEYSRLTNGKFDVSVQPLWQAYVDLYSESISKLDVDNNEYIQSALNKVGWENINVDAGVIALNKAGMALTFNGIAQGYITDKVTQLLAKHGLNHALVNMGEIYGMNPVDSGKPWTVGIENAHNTTDIIKRLSIRNQAVATSGGYGTLFAPGISDNHLIDPQTGASSSLYDSITVVADNATTADAMSTAFSLMPAGDIKRIAKQLDVQVYAQLAGADTIEKIA